MGLLLRIYLLSFFKLDRGTFVFFTAKTGSKENRVLIVSVKFPLLESRFILCVLAKRYLSEAAVHMCAMEKLFCKTHGKTPAPEFLFDKIAGLQPAISLKKKLSCFTVNFLNFSGQFFFFFRKPQGKCC